MPRYKQAPWGFDCPYKNRCPNLDQLSTSWVYDEYKRSHIQEHNNWLIRNEMNDEIRALIQTVREQEEQIDQLKAENKRLHQQKFKCNRKKRTTEKDYLQLVLIYHNQA